MDNPISDFFQEGHFWELGAEDVDDRTHQHHVDEELPKNRKALDDAQTTVLQEFRNVDPLEVPVLGVVAERVLRQDLSYLEVLRVRWVIPMFFLTLS